jgi:type IV pilus assembly protein PilY1
MMTKHSTIRKFIWLGALLPILAQAEFLDLASTPLQTSGSSDVKPNLMFILDDSGSMGREYTPDSSNSAFVWLFDNSTYNTQYYNPSVTYLPAVTASNVSMGNQTNFNSVKADVTDTGAAKDGTVNLVGSADYFMYVAGEYCTTAALTSCIKSSQPTTTNTFPAEVRWCNSASAATAATLTGSMSCQSVYDKDIYKYLRQPRAAYTLEITGVNGTVNIQSIKVNNVELLSGTVSANSSSGLANAIATSASNTLDGLCNGGATAVLTATSTTSTARTFRKCQVSQTNITSNSNGVIKFTTVAGAPLNQGAPVQVTYSGTATIKVSWDKASSDVPGSLVYVKITNTLDSYPLPGSSAKNPDRTDCAGNICNYQEEMTNFSNWYTYYRTRLQAMKTAASLAFSSMDSRYRIGFMRICDDTRNGANTIQDAFLAVSPFDNTQKTTWYKRLYAATSVCGYTPIRLALSQAGRYFAGNKKLNSVDPMQYACQPNFTLLTTDGYWNDTTNPTQVNGTTQIGNQDGSSPKPLFDSSNAANTLADTAKYFYDTDIRDGAFSNCTGTLGSSVCGTTNDYPKQNMVTLTLGLGIDGTLVYTDDYKTQVVGDYNDLKLGNKNWPNPLPAENGTRIDDLWHAAVNAGGTYYSAKNPKLLRESLAKGLSEIKAIQGASAAAAASSLAPTTGDNFQYVASYQTVKWIGNLEARTVDVKSLETSTNAVWCVENVTATACPATTEETRITGNGSTSIYCKSSNSDQSSCDKAGGILGAVLGTSETSSCYVEVAGSCKGRLQTQVANGTRKIFVNSGNSLVPFTADSLSADQRDVLSKGYLALSQMKGLPDSDAKIKDVNKVSKLVDYLRGNKTYEDTSINTVAANRLFRERQATLGDISQSRPNYFKTSNVGYLDGNYKAFKASTASRTPAVYVGANDGMLHAFDANTGDELWAFIPTPAIANLANLADKEYGASYHTNFVNGSPEVADVCVSGCSGGSAVWRTILVSGLNGGGRGYFALDVTVPETPVVLWEFNAQPSGANSNLGFTYGNPVITKMQDGRWVVVFTSGYNNGNDAGKFKDGTLKPNSPQGDGRGYLFVRDANTGAEVKTLTSGEGNAAAPSGLSRISAYAEQMFENNTAVNIYGGDLNGNVWRFNINTGAVTKIATLSIGTEAQRITTQPELGKVDKNVVLMIGTGKFLEPADLTNTPVNSAYVIKDSGQTSAISRAQSNALTPVTLSADRKVTSSKTPDFETGYGWYVDFPAGERVNLDPLLLNGVLLMPTLVPSSQACSGAGYGWFNYFDYKKNSSLLASGIVSEKMTTPAVGYNIVYDSKGVPHVVVTGSNDPTPQQLSMDDQVFGLSGAGTTTEIFKQKTNGSYGTKQSWHELIQ